jgi:hypothetical protein
VWLKRHLLYKHEAMSFNLTPTKKEKERERERELGSAFPKTVGTALYPSETPVLFPLPAYALMHTSFSWQDGTTVSISQSVASVGMLKSI